MSGKSAVLDAFRLIHDKAIRSADCSGLRVASAELAARAPCVLSVPTQRVSGVPVFGENGAVLGTSPS